MKPIEIDLSGLGAQFNLASEQIDELTEICVGSVSAAIYANWEALAKQRLNSTLPEYLQNLINVDKGRFEKQIILTGKVANMIEQGASAFDMKEGFKKSRKVKYTITKYNSKGTVISQGGEWYLSIPFRIGTPGTLGQAGFTGEMPQEIYDLVRVKSNKERLGMSEIPSPYDVPLSREAILNNKGEVLFDEYKHRHSIYEGLAKRTGVHGQVNQNTYGTFRRAGANSDPMSWIHKGIKAYRLADEAVKNTDVETIVENEVTQYLERIL